jgi:hypothetical protein
MHIDERGEVALAAQQQRRRKPRCVGSQLLVVTISVVVAHSYGEDPPRVTASRNRLVLSLTKHIRHGLVAKINGKRRPRTYEALGQISVNYSRTRRALVPISSPRHTMPDAVRRGERAHTCDSPFLLSSPHLQVYRE